MRIPPPRTIPPPHRLFDYLIAQGLATTDSALGKILGISAVTMSRIRHEVIFISPLYILRIYDRTGMSIEEIRELL